MNIFFKNIRLISPEQNVDETTNIWIKNGIINSITKSDVHLDNDTELINSENLVCSPGLFDMHVHLREPGYEYKEDIKTGSDAAINGGFTGVCCMPNTNPTIDNATVVEFIKNRSKMLLVDVYPAAALTNNRDGKQLSPMLELNDVGAVMFTDDGCCVMNSEVMKRAFDYAAPLDLLISQHCEDHSLTEKYAMNEGIMSFKLGMKGYPSIAEEIILSRDIMIASYCGNLRYHASHISTKGSVEIIREAKSKGLRITTEVTPHHFTFNEEKVLNYETHFKMNPPLRTQLDIEAIIEGLKDNTIDCIATDHAPHALHEKEVEFERAPNGIIGLETSLGVTLTMLYHTNVLTLNDIIMKMSVNPRKILGLQSIQISEGKRANITIFSPDQDWVVDKTLFKSKSKNTPYHGMHLKGKPVYTINNNKIIKCNL